jgi:hypothetical protein
MGRIRMNMKWFALLGLLLFLGVVIAPSINADVKEKEIIEPEVVEKRFEKLVGLVEGIISYYERTYETLVDEDCGCVTVNNNITLFRCYFLLLRWLILTILWLQMGVFMVKLGLFDNLLLVVIWRLDKLDETFNSLNCREILSEFEKSWIVGMHS